MYSRYISVKTIRVRFSEDEMNLIKTASANSSIKTTTAFFRELLNQATLSNASLDDNELKLITAENFLPKEETIDSLRLIGRQLNYINKEFSLRTANDVSELNAKMNLTTKTLIAFFNKESVNLAIDNNVVLKENISTQKTDKLVKEINPSFEHYQIDVLNDLHAMSEIKSLSNFMRVLFLSLLKNNQYIFNIENSSSSELKYHLSQISSNLNQAENKLFISRENVELIQKCQIAIARLMIASSNAKTYSVLKRNTEFSERSSIIRYFLTLAEGE